MTMISQGSRIKCHVSESERFPQFGGWLLKRAHEAHKTHPKIPWLRVARVPNLRRSFFSFQGSPARQASLVLLQSDILKAVRGGKSNSNLPTFLLLPFIKPFEALLTLFASQSFAYLILPATVPFQAFARHDHPCSHFPTLAFNQP